MGGWWVTVCANTSQCCGTWCVAIRMRQQHLMRHSENTRAHAHTFSSAMNVTSTTCVCACDGCRWGGLRPLPVALPPVEGVRGDADADAAPG